MKSRLSETIRAFRKERGMTQEQLAEAMRVTVGAVYKWESGRSTPELELIIELAELFGISTDVLIGYEWRNGSMRAALERIADCRRERRYDEGIAEAEIALKKYPNCFDIVYQSAALYSEAGMGRREQKICLRALELSERACGLIAQNTDETVSELSIRNQMAGIHLSLGHVDTCVDMLKQYNVYGINNARLGMILADCCHRTKAAAEYLGTALTQSLKDLNAILLGYANVFFQNRDYRAMADCIEWLRGILRFGCQGDEIRWSDRYDCVLLALCAEAHCLMGDPEAAKDCLREAIRQAARFDGADIGEIRASELTERMGILEQTYYDNCGTTVMEAVEQRVLTDAEEAPQLSAIWAELKKEVQ